MPAGAHNRCFVIESDGRFVEFDLASPARLGLSRDYLIDTLRAVDGSGLVSGLTFYVSTVGVPPSLPRYGDDVVLLVITDELYQHRSWYADLLAMVRLQPRTPYYLDGLPTTGLHVAALVHYLYKSAQHLKSVSREWLSSHRETVRATRAAFLPGPIGPYADFEASNKPIAERQFDLSFMGSVDFRQKGFQLRKLMASPKTVSRRRMAEAMNAAAQKYGFSVYSKETANFDASVGNEALYLKVMSETRIALCPRGTICDTYRFFEACKLGCVVVCEPLPDTWYYRGHPGIVVRDWRELDDVLPRLLRDPELMARKSRECFDYWQQRVQPGVFAREIERFLVARQARSSAPRPAGPVAGQRLGS